MAKTIKIYTKTGDRGTTALFGGQRVEKGSLRIAAYGTIDELNSVLGVVIAQLSLRGPEGRSNLLLGHSRPDRESVVDSPFRGNDNWGIEIVKKLLRVQSELFVLGSDLASPHGLKIKTVRVNTAYAKRLEGEIDQWTKKLPPLKNFILPGGSKVGAQMHLARTVARRAERAIVSLGQEEKINENAIVYINRLSDWLFTLARYVNRLEGDEEVIWKGRG